MWFNIGIGIVALVTFRGEMNVFVNSLVEIIYIYIYIYVSAEKLWF